MNTKLSEVFPWSSDRSLEGKLVLLLDEHIPGSSHTAEFLLTSLLLKYLTPRSVPTNVLLLLCNHPLGHYESIMRKNYIDPRQCLASGQLTVINLHAMEADKPPATDKMDLDYCWEELERWQEQGMRFPGLRGEEAPFVLLVDDLDILELIAPAVDVARRFVVKAIKMLSKQQGLQTIAGYARHPAESRLVFQSMDLQQADVQMDPSTGSRSPLHGQQPSLAEYLRYRCDVTVIARPLKTGPSSAVHGMLQVLQHRACQQGRTDTDSGPGVVESLLQYKALDTGVTCSLSK